MGAGAQVHELTLLIEANGRVLGQVVNQLHLVGLALLLHILHSLCPGQLEAFQLQFLLADLAHLRFQLLQLVLGKGLGGVKIVIEAIVNRRADGQLYLGMQTLHGLGQDVGAGVPVGFAIGLIFKGVQIFFAHGWSLLFL